MFEFPKQMKRVFRDEKIQAEFERNGFVRLPFYNQEEILYLNGLYEKLHPKEETGFYSSTFSKDKAYRKTTDEEIRRVGSRSIDKYLQDVLVVCGSYIVKYPGPDSVMGVHQDMTLVDESEFTGINIWCPLVDLNDENGVLYALPKSHRIFPTYRGSSIPNIYDEIYRAIPEQMEPIYLKAGEAIFFDQSILHYSPPNLSKDKRVVTNIYFSHKDVRFRTAYYPKEKYPNKIELFEQDLSFMTNFEQFGQNIFDRPKIGKSLGLVEYDFPVLRMEHITNATPKKNFLQRVKSIFVS